MAVIYNRTGGNPLYQELADRIGEDILARGLRDGDLYCTMKSLCGKFEASFITVRNAVSLLEEQGVVICRSAVGICIRNVEKLKLLHSFGKIVLILSAHKFNEMHPYYSLRLSAMLQALAQKGFLAKVCSQEEVSPEKLEMFAPFTQGIISSSNYYGLLQNSGAHFGSVPKVFFYHDGSVPPAGGANGFILNDERSQDELCIRYLEKLNFRRLLFVHSDQTIFSDLIREHFADRISEYTYSALPSVATGRDIAGDLIDMPSDTVFLVEDDYVAIGVYEIAMQSGIDLIKSHRVLLKSSPLFSVIEQMGFPVIGFSPVDAGSAAVANLLRMMEAPGESFNGLISPSCNRNV